MPPRPLPPKSLLTKGTDAASEYLSGLSAKTRTAVEKRMDNVSKKLEGIRTFAMDEVLSKLKIVDPGSSRPDASKSPESGTARVTYRDAEGKERPLPGNPSELLNLYLKIDRDASRAKDNAREWGESAIRANFKSKSAVEKEVAGLMDSYEKKRLEDVKGIRDQLEKMGVSTDRLSRLAAIQRIKDVARAEVETRAREWTSKADEMQKKEGWSAAQKDRWLQGKLDAIERVVFRKYETLLRKEQSGLGTSGSVVPSTSP